MKGFFTLHETSSLSHLGGKVQSCVSCGLGKNVNTLKMPPYGHFKKHILVVSDFPSHIDDERGIPLQDGWGRMLSRQFKKIGIDLFNDCVITHSVGCTPNKPTDIGTKEIEHCRKQTLRTIQEYQPKIIVLLGINAVESVLGHRWKKGPLGTIHKWRGWAIPDQDFSAWVFPVYDMKFVKEGKEELGTVWDNDFLNIGNHLTEPFQKWEPPQIHTITDLSILNTITDGLIAIDYETTGLKPHAPEHRIVCAAVSVSPDKCYTFLMPDTKEKRKPFLDLLARPTVGKMAQNMKYEEAWSVHRLKQSVVNWQWDSMLASHILDNRQGITGLKFQTYVQFGVIDYDSEVSPYLQSASQENGSNAHNRIMEMLDNPRKTQLLLEYCGMDTIAQYRLAMKQIKQMDYSFLPF